MPRAWRTERRKARASTRRALLAGGLLFVAAAALPAQPPAGYYDGVDTTTAAALRATLHEVIDDHTRFPYTSSSTDTWDILNLADEDPDNTGNIIDVYKNASYAKISGGSGAYNREHTWPKSYGFPNDNSGNYPYTDCHMLFLSDAGYNSSRSNKPYRDCHSGCAEKPTEANDGRGGGSGTYPGNSNWTEGSFTQGTWETWGGRKGDVARALLYMDVRYEGGIHGGTGAAEPDLVLTDNESLIDISNTGGNESVAYMGMLAVLLQWHADDPVDSREIWRNEVVYSFQGNRNPFIDHPEWVACVFQAQCSSDASPPAAPTGLSAAGGDGIVDLAWNANGEPDLDGYHVYRATASGGPYSRVNGAPLAQESYTDSGVSNGTTYYYVVTAVDTSGNESGDSNEASATPEGSPGGSPEGLVLSEVFYDASGSDDGLEWVELYNSGATAIDLSGFSLGNGGTDYTYSKVQLSGTIAPGATFLVGGPTSGAANAAPVFDLAVDFNPDFQNSGSAADGVALFDVPAASLTPSTVPIDAVVYGPVNTSGLIDETGAAGPPEVADAPAGSSIERTDLAGSWQVQGSPTPNAAHAGLGGGGGGPSTLHVAAIDLSTSGGGKKHGIAAVTVVDDLGAPVAGATVSGTFSGDYSESGSAATDANGVATLQTDERVKGSPSFTFCVDDVTHGGLAYAPAENVETCDTL